MRKTTHIIIAGIGCGSPEHITIEALNEAERSDVILVPRSKPDQQGIAEHIIRHHMPEREVKPVFFPMTSDAEGRGKTILSQVEAMSDELDGRRIFFPVIGDSTLYSTGAYLLEAMMKIFADVDVKFVPGISAHSTAASCAKKFLAMSDEILTIIPGTSSPEKISSVLEHSDSAVIYKPTAIRDLRKVIDPLKFRTIMRVEHAGNPELERIIEGDEALEGVDEYMSVILLQR